MTNIEWAEKTWNPIVGCTVESKGCTNCYAMQMAGRLEKMNPHGQSGYQNPYHGTTKCVNGKAVWTGKIGIAPEKTLTAPLRRRKPTDYFVNSMGDLFHPNVPDTEIDKVFAVMALCPQHTFKVLTKHPERMRAYLTDDATPNRIWAQVRALPLNHKHDHSGVVDALINMPLPNVWLGTSVEDQATADARIPHLLATPAAKRFISAEPLLGPVDLEGITTKECGIYALSGVRWDGSGPSGFSQGLGLDWVICGGESGPGERPMHPDWVRSLRDQCVAAEVPFFFKQWGEYADHTEHHANSQPCNASSDLVILPTGEIIGGGAKGYGGFVDCDWRERGAAWMCKTGKKAAGRLLDGREWNEVPV